MINIKNLDEFMQMIIKTFNVKKDGQLDIMLQQLRSTDVKILNSLWAALIRDYTDDYPITWGKIKKIADANGIELYNRAPCKYIAVCPECGHKFSVDDLYCPACRHNQNDYAKTCHECGYIYVDKVDGKWDVKRICPECVKEPNSKIVYRRTVYLMQEN